MSLAERLKSLQSERVNLHLNGNSNEVIPSRDVRVGKGDWITVYDPRAQEWLRSLQYGELLDLHFSGNSNEVIPVRVVRIDQTGDWITVFDERAEDLPGNCHVISCYSGQSRLGATAIPRGGFSYAGALSNKQPASTRLFARYIMTGVNPSHYGELRSVDIEHRFDYAGCLDAPSAVPGGSHQAGFRQQVEGSTSLVLRKDL